MGEAAGIDDGLLVENLGRALVGLVSIAAELGVVSRVVTHAWEGGHHDHDAGHLLGRALGDRLGIADKCRQYMLYRSPDTGRGMMFASPRAELGEVERTPIPFRERWRYVGLLRHYRSQLRVMIQLGPHIARAYGIDGVQVLQHLPPVDILSQRPATHLLYERWGLYTHRRFTEHAGPFIADVERAHALAIDRQRQVI
jgi:hypothetical protein